MSNITGPGFFPGIIPPQRRDHADAARRVKDVCLGVLNAVREGELIA
jgi:hypothetical protein